MKAQLLLIMALSVFSIFNHQSYNSLWKEVNQNLEDRLPQTAETNLDEIEQKAVEENNYKELLKTFLYRFKIFALQDENPIETSINFAEENISRLQEPEKFIFNIAIASLYETYLNANYHIIKNNIPIYNNQQTTDDGQRIMSMKFWDEAAFRKVINQYYEAALSDVEALQNNTTASYSDVLDLNHNVKTNDENAIEPTLYDYVMHKIIAYVETSLHGVSDNGVSDNGVSDNGVSDNSVSDNSVSDLYNDLISFDKKNNYNDAAIYNEIHLLKYEYNISDDYESYYNSLDKIKNENIGNPLVTSVMALQAEAVLRQQDDKTTRQQEALEICDEAISMFPNSVGAERCKSIRSEILEKELTFSMKSVVLPDQDIPASVTYRNLTNPNYRIYKLNQDEVEELQGKSKQEIVKSLLKKIHIVENEINLPENNDYQQHTSDISLPELECGTYFIMFSKDDGFSKSEEELPAIHSFQVSNLSFVTTRENNDLVIYVLDRDSGKAVKDVNVNIYKRTYDYQQRKYIKTTIKELKTDKKGIVRLSDTNDNSFYINLYADGDRLLSDAYFYNYQNKGEEKLRERTTFFTDRAVYRPGQTVYFKGIVLNQNSKIKELVVGKEVKVTFRDSNWQEVATQTFTTNEFGSFDGSFVIPNNLLNAYFNISTESGSINFKVEEYKRPTFEITFNQPDEIFKLNEDVDMSGSVKAYAGFGLDNVNYNYTIVRRAYFPYRFWWFANYDTDEKQIAFGDGKTDENGNFNINFKLIPDENEKDKLPVFEYIVTVNATNAQGETQTKKYTLKASDIDVIIDVDNQQRIVSKDDLESLIFNVKNLKENPVEAKIIRKIYKDNGQLTTDNGQQHCRDAACHVLTMIYEDVINVNGRFGLFQNVNKNLEIGEYVVELISADNELAKTSVRLTLVDYSSNKMPCDTMCISYYDKESVQPNEDVNFYLGSSAKDVRVYVMIKHGNEVRYSDCKTISDKVLKVSYKVKEEDRGSISFQAFFVKHNTINIVQHNVSVPYDNLKLDLRLDVERDDLLPGSEEKWNLTVRNYDNDNGLVANVLASMYDASLDVFAKNQWNFNTMPNIIIPERPRSDDGFNNFSCSADNQYYRYYELFDYYLFSEVSLIPYSGYYRYGVVTAMELKSMPKQKHNSIAVKAGGVDEVSYDFAETEEMVEITEQVSSSQNVENQEMSIRENFNETAFFYPNLITNEDGSLTFSFTMPDALTRWNLMMLAYTKDLKVGTLNKTFTSSKPLMIMSDMPRFCYENDTLWLVANVIRTTDNGQQTTDFEHAFAKLEIFDALTMQPLDLILSQQEINLDEIPDSGSKAVRWMVVVDTDSDMDLLAFRFSVKSENFSDAEQRLLPVLSDEVFMTETYSMTVDANSEKTFDFDFNNENERNQGLTLNFCANPVWYAIQALPYLSQETGEHADVAFNVFYANNLASYIAHNIPNLLNYIKKWEIETPDALMSQLQKDESLKAIMLQETPWVLDAKTEAEQRARIANLFDINALKYKTDETLNLIKEKQSVNGGWSWMSSMPESSFITQYILGGFGRLYKMNVIESLTSEQQNVVDLITKKAIEFLCDEIIKDYDTYKDIKKFYVSGLSVVNELYALSFFDFEESIKYKNAKDFFVENLQKYWLELDFEAQAKVALILSREGKNDVAELIMKSLKERMRQLSSSTDVSGQALIMEAFWEISPDKEMLDEMMIWLLNNKRTNMWENARSSVDAIYAIMETTSQQSTANGQQPMVKVQWSTVNGQQSTVNSQESIFLQRYWDAEEMKDFDNLTIENNSDNVVWGGLFRQYFVSIDEVRKHESPLKIDRELFVERVNEDGAYLVPIEENNIKVGDKIVVNLAFEASQDMEFVFLKDLRAACLEPTDQMSRYRYSDGMSYYQSNSDTFMGFYFDNVTKGRHQVSYSMYVTKEGDFSNGYALIQCMYAPEFSAYSEGMRISVGR